MTQHMRESTVHNQNKTNLEKGDKYRVVKIAVLCFFNLYSREKVIYNTTVYPTVILVNRLILHAMVREPVIIIIWLFYIKVKLKKE